MQGKNLAGIQPGRPRGVRRGQRIVVDPDYRQPVDFPTGDRPAMQIPAAGGSIAS